MAYTSNILALVGADKNGIFSPNRLTIWTTDGDSIVCEREFFSKIESVKLNKTRLIVCVKDKIHIYNMINMKFLKAITANYSLARLALSPCHENPYLVYSDSIDTGKTSIYDTHSLSLSNSVMAHKSPILKLTINYYGTHIATCSCKGTIIRIFSIPKGERLYSFRRGMNSAQVFFVCFNINSNYMLLSSNSGTIHIFKMSEEAINTKAQYLFHYNIRIKKQEEKQGGWFGGMMKALLFTNDNYESVVESTKSCMTLKRAEFTKSNICAMLKNDESIIVINNEGRYVLFKINLATLTDKVEKEGFIFDL